MYEMYKKLSWELESVKSIGIKMDQLDNSANNAALLVDSFYNSGMQCVVVSTLASKSNVMGLNLSQAASFTQRNVQPHFLSLP